MVRSEGFEYKAQKPEAPKRDSQKWAWIGNTPGNFVVLRLSTVLRLGSGPGSSGGGAGGNGSDNGTSVLSPARLYLGHVCSWQPLGSARVECISGCTCNQTEMPHQWGHRNTQSALLLLQVGVWVGGLFLYGVGSTWQRCWCVAYGLLLCWAAAAAAQVREPASCTS